MLITGPEICHVDRCQHGCTATTGCQGIEWRVHHAEQHLRDRIARLESDAAEWGFTVATSIAARASSPSGASQEALTAATPRKETRNAD